MLLVLSCLGAGRTEAQTATAPPASDDQELARLMAVLNEETAVATRTRLNADFVPGIVTVLQGEELEALGIETAWEALSLVAGVQAVKDPLGQPSLVVRGLDFAFNSGNVKILIDGVRLSRESAGINGIALQIPIQEVARIEVIRGPGSVVYGDFAFMGLVNVVTRRDGFRAFLRQGGDRATTAGAHGGVSAPDGWNVSLSAAGSTGRHAPLPAPREADERQGWSALHVSRAGFSLTAEAITRRLDEPSGAAGPTTAQTHVAVEARYGQDLAPGLRGELRASYQRDRFDTRTNGFRGSLAEGGVDLTWTGWSRHTWLFSASYADGTIDDASANLQAPPGPGPPPPPPLSIVDQERGVLGLVLQDRVELSSRVAVTAGLRYDRYTDLRDRVTPRVAAVLRATDRFIVKLQYAEGFRAPTFFEEYAGAVRNSVLRFEVNRTTELNAVYRAPQTVLRVTLFTSRIEDMIYVAGAGLFDNSRSARAEGFELEAEQQLGKGLKLQANLSRTRARDDRNLERVLSTPGSVPEWLANLTLLYRPGPSLLVAGRLTYVGDRDAAGGKGYELADLVATRNDLLATGLQLRAGVKSILDDEPRYYFGGRPGVAAAFLTYPGRTYFVQLAFAR